MFRSCLEETHRSPAIVSPPRKIDRTIRIKPLKLDFTNAECSKDEVGDQPALITPTSCSVADDATKHQISSSDANKWTRWMLAKVLQKQPPLHVVQFILSVDPKAAGIPREGPTPLQIAIQNNASTIVIQELIEACPFALFVGGNDSNVQDLLSYVKQHRREDTKLIEILERPLKHRIDYAHGRKNDIAQFPFPKVFNIEGGRDHATCPLPPQEIPVHVDAREIENMKVLCAQVIKGFKKLSKQVSVYEEEKQKHLEQIDDTHEILAKLQQDQKKHFHRQIIAFEMREKALQGKMKKLERRYAQKCEQTWEDLKEGMEWWKASTEDRLEEWHGRLESEIQVGENFRSDLTRWIDEQTASSKTCPFVFATSLGEVDETTPLVSSDEKESLGPARMRTWLSRLLKKEDKKGSWKAFRFRRHGRIKLKDTTE